MKKTHLATALTAAGLLLTQPATAANFLEEVTWVPQIGVQYKNLQFEQDLSVDGERIDKGDFDADLPSLALSFTAIYKKAYISFKYEDSFGDTATDSDVPFTNASTDIERTDYAITFGYNVWNNVNLFAGYMDGETTLTPEPLCPIDPTIADPICGNGGGGFLADDGNLAQDHYVLGLSDYEQTYEEDGWFLGGSYAWKVSDVGTLSFSLAYADLESTYTDNYLKDSSAKFKLEGDADGLSFGVNWSQPITKTMGYYLDLRTQQYDAKTKDANGNFPGFQAKTEETMTSFTAGVQWYL